MSAADKKALADKLARLSDELHTAAGQMGALGWAGHGAQLASMGSLTSIYGHQLQVLTVDEALAGLEDEIGGAAC